MSRPALEILGAIIEGNGQAACCIGCCQSHEWQEGHPYGNTTAYEDLWECNAETEADAEECPRVQAIRDLDNPPLRS